jgi:hypothetical protein
VFFIVNKTKKHITLPDIKISLGPRQALDLDKLMDRSESEKSRHLKAASHNGDVEIRVKDGNKPKKNAPVQAAPDMGKMKDDIIKEMKDELQSLKQPKEGLSKEDLIAAMQELISSMPAKEVIVREGGTVASDEEEVEINEDLLGEINKRAMNKMVKNTESGEVKYKEEKQKNDLDSNINELENLLGLGE